MSSRGTLTRFNYCGTLKIMILKQTKYDDWFVCFLFLFFWIEINFGYLLSRNVHVKSPLFEITSSCFACLMPKVMIIGNKLRTFLFLIQFKYCLRKDFPNISALSSLAKGLRNTLFLYNPWHI